ncbi:hypothetical protein C2U72_01970 [Prosthecomicrobium hirschii]|nr:hypothetical protein C2U72_01970 [Prosthecomicrobium hirschii]
MNALHPDRMTAAERLAEVADILARGILRLRERAHQSSQTSERTGESSVDFTGDRCRHATAHRRRTA